MTCPNLSNPDVARDFNELKDAIGEKPAYAVWNLNNGHMIDKAPSGAKSIVFEKLLEMMNGIRSSAIQLKTKLYYPENRAWIASGVEPTIEEVQSLLFSSSKGTVKKGVSYIFKKAQELSRIGTQEEYSEYLDTIFPNSKFKDIVYHGTNDNFEEFKAMPDKAARWKFDLGQAPKGFFFSKTKERAIPHTAYEYGNNIVPAILDMRKPEYSTWINTKRGHRRSHESDSLIGTWVGERDKDSDVYQDEMFKYMYKGDKDKINEHLANPKKNDNPVVAVFDTKQIHVLGSTKDIAKFKAWKESKLDKQKSSNTDTISKEDSAFQWEYLSTIFRAHGVELEKREDSRLEENANVTANRKGKVTISYNPNKLHKDTLPHEFGHIYIDILGWEHPLIQQGIEQLRNSDLWNEVAALYPDLNYIRLEKEILATALGREAAALFDNEAAVRRWNHWFNRFVRAIADALGIEFDVSKRLAMEMVSARMRKGTGKVSTYHQRQVASGFSAANAVNSTGKPMLSADKTKYIDAQGNSYARLTEWVKDKFTEVTKQFPESYDAWQARQTFKEQDKNPDTDTATVDGYTFTFDEMVEHNRKRNNRDSRGYGTYAHLIIKNFIQPTQESEQEKRELELGTADTLPIETWKLGWLTKEKVESIFEFFDFNFFDTSVPDGDFKDKVEAEFPLFSKLLGIGTTADLLVKHHDGTISNIDWKTGQGFFDNGRVDKMLKYGQTGTVAAYDSKEEKAKLELALRSLIYKESYEPNAMFRKVAVAHLSKWGVRELGVDMDKYLKMIEAYYNDPSNGEQHIGQELKNRGLFEAYNYIATDTLLQEKYAGHTVEHRLELLNRDLTSVSNQISRYVNQREVPKYLWDLKESLGKQILEANATPGTTLDDTGLPDMRTVKRWIGNKFSVDNPLLQVYFAIFDREKLAATRRINDILDTRDKFLKPVYEEYMAKNPGKRMAAKFTRGLVNGLQYSDFYDFMWVKKTDKPGLYGHVITQDMVDNGPYTVAQMRYNNFIMTQQQELYKEVMGKTGITDGKTTKTKAELANLPKVLADDFMPRAFKEVEDIIEEKGLLSKDTVKQIGKNAMFNFIEELGDDNPNKYGMPITIGGIKPNDSVIDSRNHTLSVDKAFDEFVRNLVMKDHMDNLHHLGNALHHTLKSRGNAEVTAEFLKDQMNLLVLNDQKKSYLIKPKHVKYNGKTYVVSIDKVMMGMKSWVSASSMWLKLPNGVKNFALIMMMDVKKGLEGSFAKRMGVGYDDIDFTLSDLMWGHIEYLNAVKDMMLGRGKSNKLVALMEHFKYMPSSYDFKTKRSDMIAGKNKIFDQSHFYIFQSIGEEYGAYTILAAQLRHKRMGSKSAWDSYELKDGKIEYTGDSRGSVVRKIENGQPVETKELRELDSYEINRMKRMFSMIHGGYREEEKTALELYALGQWTIQFKKYLPTVLEQLFQGSYQDTSIGYYEKIFDDANGQPVYKWSPRINEGRFNILAHILLNVTGINPNPKYNFKKGPNGEGLGSFQKTQMIDFLSTIAIMGLMQCGYWAMFDDDDDDKNPYAIQMRRLIDDSTQSVSFWDILNSAKDQTVLLPKLHKMAVAVKDFLLDGMILGNRTQRGTIKGNGVIISNLPFINSFTDWNKYVDYNEDGSIDSNGSSNLR